MRLIAKQARRAAMGCGVLAAMLLLASCGGSSEPTSDFDPSRIIAFGDETSSILDIDGNFNGHKFSVNGTVSATDPTIDCRSNPIWIQIAGGGLRHLRLPDLQPGRLGGVRPAEPDPRHRRRARRRPVGADRRPARRERRFATTTW